MASTFELVFGQGANQNASSEALFALKIYHLAKSGLGEQIVWPNPVVTLSTFYKKLKKSGLNACLGSTSKTQESKNTIWGLGSNSRSRKEKSDFIQKSLRNIPSENVVKQISLSPLFSPNQNLQRKIRLLQDHLTKKTFSE